MIRGLYTSALGMTTQMKRMDVVSDNIANVNTTGFKKDQVVTRSFTEELMKRLDDPEITTRHDTPVGKVSQGVFVDDVYTDFSNGSLRNTGGSLDLALSGKGFFIILTKDVGGKDVEMYSRDGSFTLAQDGALMTKEGNRVMGQNGAVVLPTDAVVSIDEDGRIYSNGETVDQLKLIDFEDRHTLRKAKDNLYTTTTGSKAMAFGGKVVQGFLENSNVNSVKEMVDMITVNRAYEANQRMVTIHDTTLSRAVNDLGKK